PATSRSRPAAGTLRTTASTRRSGSTVLHGSVRGCTEVGGSSIGTVGGRGGRGPHGRYGVDRSAYRRGARTSHPPRSCGRPHPCRADLSNPVWRGTRTARRRPGSPRADKGLGACHRTAGARELLPSAARGRVRGRPTAP